MTTNNDTQAVNDVEALAWFLTVCDTLGMSVTTDAEFIEAIQGPLVPLMERGMIGQAQARDKLRAHAELTRRYIWDTWIVDNWYMGYDHLEGTPWEKLQKV